MRGGELRPAGLIPLLRFAALVILLSQFLLPAQAADLRFPQVEEFWEQAGELGVEPENSPGEGARNLLTDALDSGEEMIREVLSTAVRIVAVVLLCALADGFGPNGKREGLSAVHLAGTLAVTALTMTDVSAMIGLGRQVLLRMDEFGRVLLPAVAVLTAATGQVTSATVQQGATMLFSQLLLTAMDALLIPMVYAYTALLCAAGAIDSAGLRKLADFVKGTVQFLLTAMLLAFVGYLTASGTIAGATDASAVKAAKLAISRVIPVVGGILADASETILAGAGVLRGSVGAAGMVAVLAICITPFLRLGIHYLLYRLTAGLCALAAQPELGSLLEGIGCAFGLVLGMAGAGALILLISLVSALKAVIPV